MASLKNKSHRKRKKKKRSSKYKGVYWHEQSGCWRAQVLVKPYGVERGYQKVLGNYPTQKAARDAIEEWKPKPKKTMMMGETKQKRRKITEEQSLYHGVFYDRRAGYNKRWAAQITGPPGKKPRQEVIGHFSSMQEAGQALAKKREQT